MTTANFYTAIEFDRAAHRREDEAWLAERLAHRTTHLVPVWRSQNLVTGEAELATLRVDLLADLIAEIPPIFLGLTQGSAYFAVEVSHLEAPHEVDAIASHGRFEDLRTIGPVMARPHGAIMAYARGLAIWHSRHQFCGVCGSGTVTGTAGHSRICTNKSCATVHFPRTDPAVIVLVHDGDRVVLGRSARFPPGMFSVLAGFVEPGEQLEDTVRREIMEEANIAVTDVAYQSSQPWPFPSSLMVGFRARATSFDVVPDMTELEAARWFSRDELLSTVDSDDFRLPRHDSIARRLLDDWLHEG